MCVGFEGTLVEAAGTGPTRHGILEVDDRRYEVGLTFTPEAEVGDRIIAHSGQAVRVASPAPARHP